MVTDPTLSCGFLQVPLDYHDSSVGNARLAIVKANATGERRGSVFYNPGQSSRLPYERSLSRAGVVLQVAQASLA